MITRIQSIIIKYNSRDYIIHSVSGRVYCDQIQTCLDKQSDVLIELNKLFKDNASLQKNIRSHYIDPTGESIVYMADFFFTKDNSMVSASVYDWSENLNKTNGWYDCLQVDMSSDILSTYIQKQSK